MTVGTSLPDPTDLEAIRARLADDGLGRRRPLGLGSVTIAKDALERLGDEIDAVRRTGCSVVHFGVFPAVVIERSSGRQGRTSWRSCRRWLRPPGRGGWWGPG